MKLFSRSGRKERVEAENDPDVVLGEDWVVPAAEVDDEVSSRREQRRLVALNRSPLARKIITFNMLALVVMVAGVLYLNPFRESLTIQRERHVAAQAELIATLIAEKLPRDAPLNLPLRIGFDPAEVFGALTGLNDLDIYFYGVDGALISRSLAADRQASADPLGQTSPEDTNLITSFMSRSWRGITSLMHSGRDPGAPPPGETLLRGLVTSAAAGSTVFRSGRDEFGETVFATATPVRLDGRAVAVLGIAGGSENLDALVRGEREQVLQMFFTAILVSIGLSLVLASTIANPLADLAAAAEVGRDRHARKVSPSRVRIPDLTARPDEIGRLSGAMRGMVAALYDRIEANEQFAADVAHEIKNPLASLRSAVSSLRRTMRDDQRDKLLDVVEHDVRRVDRLISDISNASRLDSELVKEDEKNFDLIKMLANISEHFRGEAEARGVEFITDLPGKAIAVTGLEARLAQVFVNLISNAVSFCEQGDAVRIWARRRENRVLVVVEDTGPGIPEGALQKIFNRFYSERPVGQFGNHSGLGLAISKQIVEAHGGVIWAENIRPTHADLMSEPLGARFVVGLPV